MITTEAQSPGHVLIVDDDTDVLQLIQHGLAKRGYHADTAETGPQALEHLDCTPCDAVLLDLRLGTVDGLEVCREVMARHPDTPVIVLTGYGSMEAAVGAMRAGAYDFTTKPVDLDALALSVRRAVSHRRLTSEVERLRAQVEDANHKQSSEHPIIGQSEALTRVLRIVDRVANSDAPVLVTGESGTGKELIARALHERSSRRDQPFVAVNCAAIPANLLESELFGHARGAFTDAKTNRRGLFLEAGEGTVFLDEIGELPTELQPKLLRVLQERRLRPVGDTREYPFLARVVTATNRDLEQEVENGTFREDLFYRVNVIHILVPPLSARGNDVLLLAQHMLERIAERVGKKVDGLTPDAAAKLLDYDWPGNVRELQNAMERAVALAQYDKIPVGDLPDRVREHRSERIVLADTTDHMPSLSQLERRYIERVLRATNGNKTQAAQILGLDRRTLYRKLERFEKENGEQRSHEAR